MGELTVLRDVARPFAAFRDRRHAGEKLAEAVVTAPDPDARVLAVPRGGAAVGAALAKALDAPMALAMVRKLHIPWSPEAGFGAVALDGSTFLNERMVRLAGLTRKQIDEVVEEVRAEVKRRAAAYPGQDAPPDVRGRRVYMVDDGLASGYTMLAAVKMVRRLAPVSVALCVPVSPADSIELVRPHFDRVVCLIRQERSPFAVASFYEDFHDLTDDEVMRLLRENRTGGGKRMAMEMTRREAMKMVGLGALAVSLGCATGRTSVAQAAVGAMKGGSMPYELPPLPYAYDALEPVISKEILTIHHDKHHAGYVKGLNSTLEKLDAARKSGDMAAVQALSRDLAFHGSGHALHSLYWESMTPKSTGGPAGDLKMMIERDFGSVDAFRAQFLAATKSVEASGWGVLAWEPMGKRLLFLQAERHEDLTIWGVRPILCCDVWEHAYYLQYQNNRGAYVDKFCEIIDWEKGAKRLTAAMV